MVNIQIGKFPAALNMSAVEVCYSSKNQTTEKNDICFLELPTGVELKAVDLPLIMQRL